MSTTGFGAQARAHLPPSPAPRESKRQKHKKTPAVATNSSSALSRTQDIAGEPSSEHQKWLNAQEMNNPVRSAPKFDMNLRDLFSDLEAHPDARPLGDFNRRVSMQSMQSQFLPPQMTGVGQPIQARQAPVKQDFYSHTPTSNSSVAAAAAAAGASQASSSPSVVDYSNQQQPITQNLGAAAGPLQPISSPFGVYDTSMTTPNGPSPFLDVDLDLDMDYSAQNYNQLHPAQLFGAEHGNVADFYGIGGGADGNGFDMLDGYFFGPNGGGA